MSQTSPETALTAPSAGGSSEIATFSGRIANQAASPFAASHRLVDLDDRAGAGAFHADDAGRRSS